MESDPNNSCLDPVNDPKSRESEPINQKYDLNSDLIDPKHDLKTTIMTLMPQNPSITYKELAASINRSTSTGKRYIQELKASGALTRIGGTKGGRWAIKRG